MKNLLVTVSGEYDELGWVALNQVGDAVFLTDDAGAIKFISPGVEAIFGYSPCEVRALGSICELFGADVATRDELDARGEIREIEHAVVSKTGEERHLLIHVKSVSTSGCTMLYACRDVTEQKSMQEALRKSRTELAHASRLAIAGQLTASIAHEVTQPLTSIVSNADAALVALDSDLTGSSTAELRHILNDVRAEGRRAADIVCRLRSLVRRQPVNPQPLELRQFIHETLRLIDAEVRRCRVTVHTEFGSPSPRVEYDPVSLQQVLLNIVINALDAMQDVADRQRELRIAARRANGFVEIAVTDNGHGIEADHVRRVFDSFFTTKPEGLGLGLAIAKSIVEQSGGSIRTESGTDWGTTFRISLPAT